MAEGLLFFYLIQVFILLLNSVGHSVLLLKIRHEENRKRAGFFLEKREDILQQGKNCS